MVKELEKLRTMKAEPRDRDPQSGVRIQNNRARGMFTSLLTAAMRPQLFDLTATEEI